MERLDADSRTVWHGRIVDLREERWRHDDGEVVTREVARHPGAVGIVAVDGDGFHLVRQPREAVGDTGLLEIPAGKLDVAGESPLETAKRELCEEIGMRAEHWTPICRFYCSPGFTDEEVHLFFAAGLSEVPEAEQVTEEEERITRQVVPLAQLDDVIADCKDSKWLIGLMWLRHNLPV